MTRKDISREPPDLYTQYIEFLKNRRGNGEDYTVQIMKVLREHPDWVRARDLKHLVSCPEATLFRLLNGLAKNGIVENKKSSRNRNFSLYRLSPSFPDFYFLTDTEMRTEHSQLSEKYLNLRFDFSDAITVITRNGLWEEFLNEKEISQSKPTGNELLYIGDWSIRFYNGREIINKIVTTEKLHELEYNKSERYYQEKHENT